jgi:hypothetical protein
MAHKSMSSLRRKLPARSAAKAVGLRRLSKLRTHNPAKKKRAKVPRSTRVALGMGASATTSAKPTPIGARPAQKPGRRRAIGKALVRKGNRILAKTAPRPLAPKPTTGLQPLPVRLANPPKGRKGRKGRRPLGRKGRKGRSVASRAARKRNPGFDIKSALIGGALLVGGALAGHYITDFVGDQLTKVAPEGSMIPGAVKLLGAVATAAAGQLVQDKFGSADLDLRPAFYAIAAAMAIGGFKDVGVVTDGTIGLNVPTTAAGTFMLSGQGLTDSGSYEGETYLPESPSYNSMLGTMEMGPMGALPPNAAVNSMLGSIFTDAQLPVPSVAPHSVMQGPPPQNSPQAFAPQMC